VIVVVSPTAPPTGPRPSLFLAGAIDGGRAEPWQDEVVEQLRDLDIVVLNPRRSDWCAEWAQSTDEPEFVRQVQWELAGIERADVVLMVFTKDATAPVSLIELGLRSRIGRMYVVCPPGFWRKANVDLVCDRYAIPRYETLAEGVQAVREALSGSPPPQAAAEPASSP
jgi:hypothetical protein